MESVALYAMAPYGFDDFANTIEYRGHWNKQRLALVTDGKWVNTPVYTGRDLYAKNAVLYPVFNEDHRRWRAKHQQGGDMLLFTQRMFPFIDTIEVVIPLQPVDPKFKIVGRVAGDGAGRVGKPYDDLHFTLIIENSEQGFIGIDGQPTYFEAGVRSSKLIRSNFYRDSLPTAVVVEFEIQAPSNISAEEFAKRLIVTAQNFASYTVDYSIPKGLTGNVMKPNEYNSGSYLSGLLHSVLGYVPEIDLHGMPYQMPGWETPIPDSYFKAEAIK